MKIKLLEGVLDRHGLIEKVKSKKKEQKKLEKKLKKQQKQQKLLLKKAKTTRDKLKESNKLEMANNDRNDDMIIVPSKEENEMEIDHQHDLGDIDDDMKFTPFQSRNHAIVPKILRNGGDIDSNETMKANNFDYTNDNILANQSQYSASNLLMHQDDYNKEDTGIRLVNNGSSILNQEIIIDNDQKGVEESPVEAAIIQEETVQAQQYGGQENQNDEI